MTPEEARSRFATSPVARLATADAAGRPHLVPVVFAVAGDTVYSAVDHKPKRSTALRRLANVAANPRVALLVDHYEDDWRALWWVRADGTGRVLDPADREARDGIARLVERYPQYRDRPPAGPVLAVDVERWTGWTGLPDYPDDR
ncbi:MAG: PPOX class F420-dependent oxidoreductase [Actinobacteria bacterium 13_1_20CM_3_71_11]|nr:MAG: PPOX class F420-dependent oxidoreductase [Actinobacteria bacterium 13_1_20CM_3_71_11]